MPEAVREMLDAATPKAVQRLVEALDAEHAIVVGNGAHAELQLVPDFDMRVKAANAILDRRFGRPSQAVTGEDGGPVRLGVVVLPLEEAE